MSVVDVLVVVEIVLMIAAIPLAILGTWRLIAAIRRSTRPDYLARVITIYLTVVTATALWIGFLVILRRVNEALGRGDLPNPEWTRPITGLLVLIILLGPWYISRVARS